MANKAGQRLNAEEVREVEAYREAGIALPEKYDRIVFDNASGVDAFYRYQTAEEEKTGQARTKAAADEVAARETLMAKVRGGAAAPNDQAVPARQPAAQG